MNDNQDTSTSAEHLKERKSEKFPLLNDLTVKTSEMVTILAKA